MISTFKNEFTGVKVKDSIEHYGIKLNGKFVMVHGDHDYETNLPLEMILFDDVLLAHSYDGKPLSKKHGWPLRLVVPKLYFWKSAKWVRGFEFMKEDKSGFWESNGFHNNADPFKEERFSNDDMYLPEDEWEKKGFDLRKHSNFRVLRNSENEFQVSFSLQQKQESVSYFSPLNKCRQAFYALLKFSL